jgi:hypothetical protein
MLAWIRTLTQLENPELRTALISLGNYWGGEESVDLEATRLQLWTWVDAHGGSRISAEPQLLIARMILCLAYEDNRELEDMGFFEDLLNNFGLPRSEINKYSPGNPPVCA